MQSESQQLWVLMDNWLNGRQKGHTQALKLPASLVLQFQTLPQSSSASIPHPFSQVTVTAASGPK